MVCYMEIRLNDKEMCVKTGSICNDGTHKDVKSNDGSESEGDKNGR